MIDLQTILTYLSLISIPTGVIYYILTLRNNQRNQDFANETRKAQLYMQISDKMSTVESMKLSQELFDMEWTDFEDFKRRQIEKKADESS